MPLEQKRNHPSPSSGCAPSARGDPGMHYDDADADVDVNGTTRTRTRTSISVPFVDHWDGRRFWSDRFYLNDNDGTASTTPPPPTPSPASPNHHAAHANKFRRCHCDCGSRGPPPTFPLIDFVNRSLDVEAAILGTFHLHPEWFLEHFPRFGGGSGSGSGSVNGGANTDANANAHNPGTVPAPVPVPIPTLILHGHRGLERALEQRVAAADELAYRTDDDDEEEEENKSNNKNDGKEFELDAVTSSRFRFFLPATPKATLAARKLIGNPSLLRLCQVHSQSRRNSNRNSNNNNAGVSCDDHPSKANADRSRLIQMEARFGVHHPKFWLLLEKGSGDLVVIVTTSNLTPSGAGTVEGSWIQRFRRRRRHGHGHEHERRRQRRSYSSSSNHKNNDDNDNYNDSNRNRNNNNNNHSTNDFGPVLQDFLIRLSEATTTTHSSSYKTNNTNTKTKTTPLEAFVQNHFGLESLSDFASAFHFETARTYLVPVVPGDHTYDPLNDDDDDDDVQHKHKHKHKYHNNNCFYYGRQRVRYVLEHLATTAPRISKRTRDAGKSDRLLVQPTSLGGDWSRSEWAAMVREYMGYYCSNSNSSSTPSLVGGATSTSGDDNDQNGNRNTKRTKRTGNANANASVNHHHKQRDRNSSSSNNNNNKNNSDSSDPHSYYRDDFWVSRQSDIVWPSDRFVVGRHHHRAQSGQTNGNGGAGGGGGTPAANEEVRPRMVTPLQETQQQQQQHRHQVIPNSNANANANGNGNANGNQMIGTITKSTLFNSSTTFNSCDPEFVSRMALYRPSVPCQFSAFDPGARNNNNSNNNNNHNHTHNRVPHFKSLARLFPNHSAMRKRGVGAADAYLSWFLMTSACLSQGAQGKTVEADADAIHTGTHTGTGTIYTADKKPSSSTSSSSSSSGRVSVVGYRNFELGVLFVSHLPKPAKQKKRSPRSSGAPQPARQQKQPKQQQRGLVYCFRRHSCSCGGDSDLDHPRNDPDSASPSRPRSTSPPPRLVHLPIPYDLRPESYFPTVATATATAKGKPTSGSSGDGNRIYCEDEDEEHDTNWWRMKENPFFHEILDSSRCVGNMLLTPFGREERRKLITE